MTAPAITPEPLISENIMLVDDDPITLAITSVQLQAAGFEVQQCASAEDALFLLESGDLPKYPTIVLTDIQMPGLWGNELARRVRAVCEHTELGKQTMILAMSGTTPRAAITQAFDGFILKPFTSEQIQQTLRNARATFGVAQRYKARYGGQEKSPAKPAGNGRKHSDEAAARALDRAVYDKLARVMPGETLDELYRLCINDSRKRMKKMVEFLDHGDMNSFREVAHSIKGGCGMVGAEQMAELARGLELDQYSQMEARERLVNLSLAADTLQSILQEVHQ